MAALSLLYSLHHRFIANDGLCPSSFEKGSSSRRRRKLRQERLLSRGWAQKGKGSMTVLVARRGRRRRSSSSSKPVASSLYCPLIKRYTITDPDRLSLSSSLAMAFSFLSSSSFSKEAQKYSPRPWSCAFVSRLKKPKLPFYIKTKDRTTK